MAKRPRELSLSATKAVERLRAASKALAGVAETMSFGNPAFQVNRSTFAVIDFYDHRDCIWLRIAPSERELMLGQPGWFPSPYDPKQVALCCALDQFDWLRLKPLLKKSYDLAQRKSRRF